VFYDPDWGEYSEATSYLDYGENFHVSQLGPQSAVPEPSSAFLLGTGLIAMSAWLRSRSSKRP
jgi:PEP-CTERM motif